MYGNNHGIQYSSPDFIVKAVSCSIFHFHLILDNERCTNGLMWYCGRLEYRPALINIGMKRKTYIISFWQSIHDNMALSWLPVWYVHVALILTNGWTHRMDKFNVYNACHIRHLNYVYKVWLYHKKFGTVINVNE